MKTAGSFAGFLERILRPSCNSLEDEGKFWGTKQKRFFICKLFQKYESVSKFPLYNIKIPESICWNYVYALSKTWGERNQTLQKPVQLSLAL